MVHRVLVTILNKADFRDALCLRHGLSLDGAWSPRYLCALVCVGGAALTTDHALACTCGGYPIARHNKIRDLLAEVTREVGSLSREGCRDRADSASVSGRGLARPVSQPVGTRQGPAWIFGLRASGRGRMLFWMYGSLTREPPCCLVRKS